MRFVTVRPRYPVGAKIPGYPAVSEILIAEPGFEAYALRRGVAGATLLACLTGPAPRPVEIVRRWYDMQAIEEFGITESSEFGTGASNAVLRVRGRWMAEAAPDPYDGPAPYALLFGLIDRAIAAKSAGFCAAMARRYLWIDGPLESPRITSIAPLCGSAGPATSAGGERAVVNDIAETFVWTLTGIALEQSATSFSGSDLHKWCGAVDAPLSQAVGRALACESAMTLEAFRLQAGDALARAFGSGDLTPKIVERYASVGPYIARYVRD